MPYAANISISPPQDSGCGMRSGFRRGSWSSYQGDLRSDGEDNGSGREKWRTRNGRGWRTKKGRHSSAPCRRSISGRRELGSTSWFALHHSCGNESWDPESVAALINNVHLLDSLRRRISDAVPSFQQAPYLQRLAQRRSGNKGALSVTV